MLSRTLLYPVAPQCSSFLIDDAPLSHNEVSVLFPTGSLILPISAAELDILLPFHVSFYGNSDFDFGCVSECVE